MGRIHQNASRRSFLRTVGIGIVGISLTPLLDGCETNSVQPLTSGSDFPFLTPLADLYVQNGMQASQANWQQPAIDGASWSLTVDGNVAGVVANPKTFTLADINTLASSNAVSFLKTLQCVYDAPLMSSATGLTGNAYWTGIPLKLLLDQVGIDFSKAKRVRFHGADGFNNNLLISRLYGSQPANLLSPMLVTGMNGDTLSAQHGYPVRLIVPEMFGFKNIKWLMRVEVTDQDTVYGTYQDAGFFDDGTLGVNSRMTRPLNNMKINAGAYQLSGFALAGAAGLQTVEVSIDGDVWQAAEIVPIEEITSTENLPANAIEQIKNSMAFPYRGVWVKWRYQWNAPAGAHTLAVRATDAVGNTQPAMDTDVSNGTNGIVTVNVTVS